MESGTLIAGERETMLRTVHFRNYKALRDVTLELGRLTVLVGPNGSGKTSVLEGIRDLSLLCREGPESVFGGERDLRYLLRREAETRCVELMGAGLTGGVRYGVGFGILNEDEPPLPSNLAMFGPTLEIRTNAANDDWKEYDYRNRYASSYMPTPILLRLDAVNLARPSYNQERIAFDGSGLPSALAEMCLTDPDRFQSVVENLRRIIPGVRRIRFRRVPVPVVELQTVTVDALKMGGEVRREYLGDSLVFDMVGGNEIPASMVSGGTLVALGLLTALEGKGRPRIVLLDDLDHALHPKAQKELIALIRELLEQDPDLQIVATAHSPYLLDHLEPQEVWLTSLGPDGSASCARLDQHPDFERWKDEMAPGEFWSLVGEKWVTELPARTAEPAS